MLTLIKKKTPDILLISETKLNYRHKVHYKNYSIIRHDRPNATQGGGTAILIKNPISNNIPKSIQYEENLDGRTADTRWRYNMALPQKDTEDKHRKNTKKYWWIRNP